MEWAAKAVGGRRVRRASGGISVENWWAYRESSSPESPPPKKAPSSSHANACGFRTLSPVQGELEALLAWVRPGGGSPRNHRQHPSHTIRATPSAEPAANAATTGPGPKRLSSHRLGGSLPVRPKPGDDSAAAPAPARATAMNPLEQRTFFLQILPSLNCLQALHGAGEAIEFCRKACGFPMVLRFSMIVHAIKVQVCPE